MTNVFELGAGVLLFIPTNTGAQLAFQFGQPDDGAPHRADARRAPVPTVPTETKSRTRGKAERQPGGGGPGACVPGGGFDVWLADKTVRDPSAPSVASMALYQSYIKHAKASAVPPCCMLTLTKFGRLLTARGFAKFTAATGRIDRRGLRLLRQPEEDGLDRYGEAPAPYQCKRAKARGARG